MTTSFCEREAIQMTLKSLLDLRVSLRREYVDRDKELGKEIKQLLYRIRELDEQNGVSYGMDDQQDGTTIGTAFPGEIPAKAVGRTRRPYQHHDYSSIAREVEAILEEATAPLTLTQLYGELQKRQGFEWPHPYIIIQKALKHSERVQVHKEGRKLMFSIVK